MVFIPEVDEVILHQVQQDLFGESGQDKDGRFAKVGFDLTLLYRLYQAFMQDHDQVQFTPPQGGMQTHDGYVLIDATAARDAEALLADLQELGLKDGVGFGRVVSGRLPILAIKEVAALPTLLSARASMPTRW